MNDFITELSKTIVAHSDSDVKVNNIGLYQNIPCTDLLAKLVVPTIGNKFGSHYLRSKLAINDSGQCLPRSNDNLQSLARLLLLDCDSRITSNGELLSGAPDPHLIHQILCAHNIGHVIYGTHSHYTGEKGNRYRVIMLTDTSHNKSQLASTLEDIVSIINFGLIEADINTNLLMNVTENKTWSQPYFTPRKQADSSIADLYLAHSKGACLKVAEPIELPPTSHMASRPERKACDGQLSAIDAFNKQHQIANLLVTYGYKKVFASNDHEKWLSPDSTSGNAGITVRDQKIFSWHGGCTLKDGYWHDSFDLMMARKRLSFKDALIHAAQNSFASDGRTTVDAYNKAEFIQSGRNTFGDSEEKAQAIPDIAYAQYRPFSNELLPVEGVPYEALPVLMGQYIQEHSAIRGCPPDFLLAALLARLGCVFAGKIKVAITRNTDWMVSPNFFWLLIGEVSSGKSNAFVATTQFIRPLCDKAREEYRLLEKTYKENQDILEIKYNATRKGLEKECASRRRDSLIVANFEANLKICKDDIQKLATEKPTLQRYTLQKVTFEKFLMILAETDQGIMLEFDEITPTFVRLSKDENAEERGVVLSGYDGKTTYSYENIGRGNIYISNLIISILGGTQPSKLQRFLNEAKNGQQDDGLLQRFQGAVFPDKELRTPEDKGYSDAPFNAIAEIFQNLNNLPSGSILKFAEDAQTIFEAWRTEATKIAFELSYPLNAHAGKSYEFVAALSAYLCLYDNNGNLPVSNCISKRNVLAAIKLGQYFMSHARRMYGLVYPSDASARALADKLFKFVNESASEPPYFTRSQIRNKDWANLTTREQRLEAIQTLIERGYISKNIDGKHYINSEHLRE